eukprot:6209091-Pleurochrysis_carterae.AAC.3
MSSAVRLFCAVLCCGTRRRESEQARPVRCEARARARYPRSDVCRARLYSSSSGPSEVSVHMAGFIVRMQHARSG